MHSIESRRNLKLYKNDGVRIRARCDGKVPVFTMSQGTGPTGPNRGMEVGPSRSSGPTTKSKKRKNTCTNDASQASLSFLDAHDKGDLCPWVLEIKHCTYKFLSEKIFEQVRINPNIPVKAVQDQLQRELEVQISMRKAFRAKAKAEREIREDHVLQYSMLRDYVVELQSTNPNTTVKIVVKRNTDPFFLLGKDLLGLDGAFMKGPFPGQVLVAVGLDSNNGIYPLAYALVEAERMYGQAYKDLLRRAASAKNVKDFEKCMLELKTMNPKARIAKFDLLLNNTCEVFNGKIVGGRDKPVITLLEYTKEYCVKRIVNVQGVIDKCSNNAEASGSASGQAQQTEPAVGQNDSGGSGAGAVIGLSAATGEGSAGVTSQVLVSETRNADGREMGDGVPTQSSAASGASEWSFL
ncbi:hypothetical protein Tco_1464984 [Tanacetum coccineum]